MRVTRILILYDNRTERSDLIPGWGFSAFIELGAQRVLFDAGADKLVLEHNANILGVDLESTDALILSHEHCDHVGAITSALHPKAAVYYPSSFPAAFRKTVEANKAIPHPVEGSTSILPGLSTTGVLGDRIKEQGLFLEGERGAALVTGCAHPGIVEMARAATGRVARPLHLLLGGFHLLGKKKGNVREIAAELKEIGVERIAPCHCTGERAMAVLEETFGPSYVAVNLGSEIRI